MANVTIKYKDTTIAEMNGKGSKTLKTSGTYCEGNVEVAYTPNIKSYEITLTKAYGRILLTTLDDEVLAHINDKNLIVTLNNMNDYVYSAYTGYNYLVRNVSTAVNSGNEIYGMGDRVSGTATAAPNNIYYPANYTGTSTSKGGFGIFHLISGKYYITPGDGYIADGTYKLTFVW